MANLHTRISPLLVLVALAFVVAVVWAGSALAAGGSSLTTDGSSDTPAATQPQTQEDDGTPQGDCPDRGDGSGSSDDSDATAL